MICEAYPFVMSCSGTKQGRKAAEMNYSVHVSSMRDAGKRRKRGSGEAYVVRDDVCLVDPKPFAILGFKQLLAELDGIFNCFVTFSRTLASDPSVIDPTPSHQQILI